MSDTMTSGHVPESALSELDGADALAGLREKLENPQSAKQSPQAEEAEVADEVEEPEPQEADGESEAQEDEESNVVEITLPNGAKINAEEAAKGYLRQDDYTRKTQELSAEKSRFQAQSSEYVKRLQGVFSEVVSLLPKEPDWAARVDEVGADQALKEQIQWNARQKVLAQAQAEIQEQNKAAMAQAQIKAREALLAGEFDASWKDPKALSKAMEGVSDYLSSYGYGAEILTSLADPNIAIIAEKARRYDELQKVKPEAKKMVKDKPKPLKPNGRQHESSSERTNKQALNRFHQTKTAEDGLSALASLRLRQSS
jgi:hypothetical protein